jgi:hypothetical protein
MSEDECEARVYLAGIQEPANDNPVAFVLDFRFLNIFRNYSARFLSLYTEGTEKSRIQRKLYFSLLIQLPSHARKLGVFGIFPCFGVRFFWPEQLPPLSIIQNNTSNQH